MLRKIYLPLCIIFPSILIAVLILLQVPHELLLQIASLLILLFLFFMYIIHSTLYRSTSVFLIKGAIFSLFVFLIEVILIVTGGIFSPFLVLIHLALLITSLFFAFPLAILVLVSVGSILAFHLTQDVYALSVANDDPITVILYVLSFLAIIPIVHILSTRYHKKDALSHVLSSQVLVEESILEGISELVFVVDNKGEIFSVNEAVVNALHYSDSQMVHSNIFNFLYLKDSKQLLITRNDIPFDEIYRKKTDFELKNLYLITTSSITRVVDMKVKPIWDMGEDLKQFCIIIRDTVNASSPDKFNRSIEAQLKYTAILEDLRKKLRQRGHTDLQAHVALLGKIENDILLSKLLDGRQISEHKVRTDLASLARKTVTIEWEFATLFRVPVTFKILHFGQEDVAPLLQKIFFIPPEKLTGPFFTIPTDVQYTNALLQKTLELAILLASTETNPSALLTIERSSFDGLIIKISAQSPNLSEEEKSQLFVPYYNTLTIRTNLDKGSGLEGYIAKNIADTLLIPFDVTLSQVDGVQHITFTFVFRK